MAERHPNQRPIASLPPELRRTTVPAEVRAWMEREVGAGVVSWRRLPGASSTAVHGIRFADGQRLVLRRYVWPGFLEDEPIAPQREVDAIRWASAAGLPAPEVVAVDFTGVPTILMSWLPGHPTARPDLHRLAEVAAALHAVDAAGLGHEYFPWYATTMNRPPRAATQPALWERALEARGSMPAFAPSFTHRDFHQGNVLWSRGRPTGIVDWSNACNGPGGCDVATMRGMLIDWADLAAADEFQSLYESLTGEPHHPYWEIANILECEPDDWHAGNIHQAEPRLAKALATLGR